MASTVSFASDAVLTIGSAVAQVVGGTLTESVDMIDFTNLSSTAREQQPDPITQNGTFSVECLCDAADHMTIAGYIDSTSATSCSVAITNNAGTPATITGSFSAWLSSYSITDFSVSGVVKISFDLTLASVVAWA